MRITASMLADSAVVAEGKLYVQGGGWDRIWTESFPTVHPALTLVSLLSVDWNEANDDILVKIELLDEDDRPIVPPLEGTINVGRPAGARKGAPLPVPLAHTFYGLSFESAGGYRFRVSSGEKELASVPFVLAQAK